MLKQWILALAVTASVNFAFAAVDVNQADQAALDGIRGIGPTMSKAILSERKQHGNFKDWVDLQARVKGIGDKNAQKFSDAGLTVNGATKSGAKVQATPADKTDAAHDRH
jgi:competence protein ComEA